MATNSIKQVIDTDLKYTYGTKKGKSVKVIKTALGAEQVIAYVYGSGDAGCTIEINTRVAQYYSFSAKTLAQLAIIAAGERV